MGLMGTVLLKLFFLRLVSVGLDIHITDATLHGLRSTRSMLDLYKPSLREFK